MDKHQLAQELCQRFYSYARGKVEWETLTAVPDDVIIDRSVRCPKCGELYVPMEWIFTAIRLSTSIDEFLNLTDGRQAHLHEYVEDLSNHLRPSGYSHPLGPENLLDDLLGR